MENGNLYDYTAFKVCQRNRTGVATLIDTHRKQQLELETVRSYRIDIDSICMLF